MIDRGNPERTGVYKEKLSDHPKIIWQTDAPSLNTPICAGNLIITNPLMAFDSKNGKKIWDASTNTGDYNHQPIYYKGVIYWDKMIGSGKQEKSVNLMESNAKTGKILYQKGFEVGSATGLFIYNNVAYISLFDGLTAYDLKMNKILWKSEEIAYGNSSTDGEVLFFHVQNGGMRALNIKNGQLLWKEKNEFLFEMGYPTLSKESIYVTFKTVFDDHKEGIIAYDKKTGKIIWQRYFNDILGFNKYGYISSLTLHKDKLFFSNIVETPIIPITEPTRYSPAGGGVYALDAQTGKLIWHADVAPFTAPISINNTLYVGGQNVLYALDEETGKEHRHLNVKDDVVDLMPYQNKLFLKLGIMMDGKLIAVL